jgi:class 3 adenylate cyclase
MFLIRKIVPSLDISGRRKNAGVIYVESKQNILEEVSDSITFRGGLTHSTANGLIAVFIDKSDSADIVKAAMEILQKSRGLGLRVKIGINFGELIVQELPTGLVKYASLGNTISYARKLAKKENSIVISDEVHAQIDKSFRFEKLDNGWLIKGAIVENW